ncbi:MAG TPA: universal stress protein [Rubrobacter sp.]|nr:universal stress protein [Rubrobacter sp.]
MMDPFPTVILLATDGSEEARTASRMAVGIAQGTGSELHLVHVGGMGGADPRLYEQMRRNAQSLLEEQAGELREAGAKIAKRHLKNGRPEQEIVALAEELGAGLIVMGSRGFGGMKRTLMGSVSDSVVRHAHCPVLVARGSRPR